MPVLPFLDSPPSLKCRLASFECPVLCANFALSSAGQCLPSQALALLKREQEKRIEIRKKFSPVVPRNMPISKVEKGGREREALRAREQISRKMQGGKRSASEREREREE